MLMQHLQLTVPPLHTNVVSIADRISAMNDPNCETSGRSLVDTGCPTPTSR